MDLDQIRATLGPIRDQLFDEIRELREQGDTASAEVIEKKRSELRLLQQAMDDAESKEYLEDEIQRLKRRTKVDKLGPQGERKGKYTEAIEKAKEEKQGAPWKALVSRAAEIAGCSQRELLTYVKKADFCK